MERCRQSAARVGGHRAPISVFTTEQIRELIRLDRIIDFYNDRYWRRFSREIMREQHFECQRCKEKGRYRAAECVHHVKHLREHPELAYSRYYIDSSGRKRRQLIALCNDCHNAEHHRFFSAGRKHFHNAERW